MKKLILLLCISVMLAGCGKENTESSSALETIDVVEDITFNVKGKEVEVIKGEEIIQILDCNYTSDKEKIFTEDYDFDGFDDLFVMMENGAMYAPGTYFRYNPDTEMYEKWDTLNKIARQVIIDNEQQTLKFRKNDSEYWMEYLIYKWDNDNLILSEHIASEDGKNFKNLPLTEETVENTTADVNITLDEATEKLWSLIDTGEENQHLAYEEIRDYGERQCYLFREYNDFDTHRATTGWYAVDVKTGECFDALNELIPLETKETQSVNILKSEDKKPKPDDYVYVDVTEYEKWHNSYIGNAELIELPFIKLTEENIEKVTQ